MSDSCLLFDAIGYVDDIYLKKYFEMEQNFFEKKKHRQRIMRLATAVASLSIVFVSVMVIFIGLWRESNTPDDILNNKNVYSIGDIYSGDNNGNDCIISFEKIVLTRNVNGNKKYDGGYLVLYGHIDTVAFAFDTNEIDLELNMKKTTDLWEQRVIFEKELSKQLSDVDLLFDEEHGNMNGKFSFVFSIDENNYDLIESKTTQTSFEDNKGAQMIFKSNVDWGGEKVSFVFKTLDVQLAEEAN
ncbi:MAG: hypothetical protein IJ292_01865 [Clostridia bacterium]|nr:hypothetical protein [Clostridia bacterium]